MNPAMATAAWTAGDLMETSDQASPILPPPQLGGDAPRTSGVRATSSDAPARGRTQLRCRIQPSGLSRLSFWPQW